MCNIDVSIIFVNYKTVEMTCDAVRSVFSKTHGLSFEVIVVDNSDDINIFEDLKNQLLSISNSIIVINANENLGFGKGNNLACNYASGKYLFFLNTDTYLVNNAIKILYDFMEINPKCGVCGGNLLSKDKGPNTSFFNDKTCILTEIKYLFGIKKYLYRILNRRIDFNYSDKPLKIKGYISGADLMIRKELFNQIGGFDRDIFMYYEENLLCYVVQYEMGFDIYSVPTAKIVHFEGGSIKKLSMNQVKESINGSFVLFSKIYGKKGGEKYIKLMHYSYSILYAIAFLNKNKREKLKLFKNALLEKREALDK